jgi:hypothetical protein
LNGIDKNQDNYVKKFGETQPRLVLGIHVDSVYLLKKRFHGFKETIIKKSFSLRLSDAFRYLLTDYVSLQFSDEILLQHFYFIPLH